MTIITASPVRNSSGRYGNTNGTHGIYCQVGVVSAQAEFDMNQTAGFYLDRFRKICENMDRTFDKFVIDGYTGIPCSRYAVGQ